VPAPRNLTASPTREEPSHPTAILAIICAVQGVGRAILAPSSLALLTASFAEGRPRARAVAAYSAVAGIGLVVGGVLADWVSWRAGFFLNVPIGLAMLLAARRYLTTETAGTRGGRFDLVGALCATLGVSALGLGVLVAVGVAATPGDASATAALVERVTTALTGAGVMLAVALVLVAAPPVIGAVAELSA
jgi:Major Facilitator Superfamily